jgi:hypothetical protein
MIALETLAGFPNKNSVTRVSAARPFILPRFGRAASFRVLVCSMVRSSRCASLESLPLFATDNVLGAALLGPDRVCEWQAMTPLLETKGLPKVDPLMHGRYVPTVRAFFDHLYGLHRGAANAPPFAPDGVEDLEAWRNRNRRS